MNYSITIQKEHYLKLKQHLIQFDEKERVAFVICGRSSVDKKEERFLTREIFLLEDKDLLISEALRVSWNNTHFINVLKLAESNDFAVAVIHNHPKEVSHFSSIDDQGEYHLFRLAFNRNGGEKPHVSLLLMPDGSMAGRVWLPNLTNRPISKIRIIGDTIDLHYPGRTSSYNSPEAFNRQQLAFGNSLIQDLSQLKVSVVGVGATGSITALLLTRLGIGELFLIDKDIIEESNLNRLHGAKFSDIGKYKVDILKDYIEDIGLGTKVITEKSWVSEKKSIEFLKTSDIIFCCTDDHAGRILLNRFAYFYLTPVIDMGLIISLKTDSLELQNLQGRISYLYPGGDCLLTRGNINTEVAFSENLKRIDPKNYKQLVEEAYVIGEGNPAPAVITFTTQIATMAVNELLNRLIRFNKDEMTPTKIYFFHRGVEIHPENISLNECRICGKNIYWGKGDMQPFLDMVL